MKLKQLRFRNLRNWKDLAFSPGPGINFVFGSNGQGKTTILEGLGVLSSLKSFKTNRFEELVHHDERSAEIEGTLVSGDTGTSQREEFSWESQVKVVLDQTDLTSRLKKTAFINGKPFKSALSYLSQRYGNSSLGFHAVVFNPADHDLVRGEPAYRRTSLDRIISAENLDHLKEVQKYQKVLEQRNALLRSDHPVDPLLLDGFTQALLDHGSQITLSRLNWLKSTAPLVLEVLQHIAPTQLPVNLHYGSKWMFGNNEKTIDFNGLNRFHFSGQYPLPSLEVLRNAFAEKLDRIRPIELRNQTTLVGPHRDDWGFDLGGQLLQTCGSQGEIRSVLLALKLSEVRSFKEKSGIAPVFLLDDFSSELDESRRIYLLDFLRSSALQVFVTTTDQKLAAGRRFEVNSGQLVDLG